ncbi:unnamed protein product [Pleuronectes platessa]|uniref:Uncharacterized protein n=1 Tax=Pleuronectes platessa TaxID=8262 RepID=A0A9N7TRU4_PLEPL|nr:unnamed protein product [Pleuronectes platessa]
MQSRGSVALSLEDAGPPSCFDHRGMFLRHATPRLPSPLWGPGVTVQRAAAGEEEERKGEQRQLQPAGRGALRLELPGFGRGGSAPGRERWKTGGRLRPNTARVMGSYLQPRGEPPPPPPPAKRSSPETPGSAPRSLSPFFCSGPKVDDKIHNSGKLQIISFSDQPRETSSSVRSDAARVRPSCGWSLARCPCVRSPSPVRTVWNFVSLLPRTPPSAGRPRCAQVSAGETVTLRGETETKCGQPESGARCESVHKTTSEGFWPYDGKKTRLGITRTLGVCRSAKLNNQTIRVLVRETAKNPAVTFTDSEVLCRSARRTAVS